MDISAESYLAAAESNETAGWELHERGHYVLSHYLAGLSVECILRAYRSRLDTTFSGRHDLRKLYREARFSEILPSSPLVAEKYMAALDHVSTFWSNTYRYCSRDRLHSHLKKLKIYLTIKSRGDDLLKASSRKMLEDSSLIVSLGASKWKK